MLTFLAPGKEKWMQSRLQVCARYFFLEKIRENLSLSEPYVGRRFMFLSANTGQFSFPSIAIDFSRFSQSFFFVLRKKWTNCICVTIKNNNFYIKNKNITTLWSSSDMRKIIKTFFYLFIFYFSIIFQLSCKLWPLTKCRFFANFCHLFIFSTAASKKCKIMTY